MVDQLAPFQIGVDGGSAVGMVFGISGVRPVPVIILAQAFNGLLLPLVAVFLWITMNDRRFLGDAGVNSRRRTWSWGRSFWRVLLSDCAGW